MRVVVSQTAQAYALACIAEAQSLTVLTAIQKGNEASLVASLSADAAAAFTAAAGTARGMSGGKADSKFALYADYQAAVHQAYALSSAGGPKPALRSIHRYSWPVWMDPADSCVHSESISLLQL